MALDFEKFAILAIKIVDELRATDANPENLDNNNSSKPIESRVNTFYRAIGLPSFRDKDFPLNNKDKFNGGNSFGEKGDKSEKFSELKDRDRNFSTKLNEEQVNTFLDASEATILSGIQKAGKNKARLKGTLFPMVVDGDIRIYPQSRRVGGAFFKRDSELRQNKITYRRPLIELVVLLRLRKEQFVNSEDKEKLQKCFSDLEEGFFDGIGENIITLEIIRSLLSAVIDPEGIRKFVNSTVKRLGKIRTNNSRIIFDDSGDAPPSEQQKKKSVELGISTEEEEIKSKRESIARENSAKLTILEFDDSISDDEITKNMKDAIFAPMILDVILSDNEEIERITEEADVQNKLPEKELRTLHKRADLTMGTFSGLSGVDVIVVMTALFSVDIADLLGLLNDESLDRLNKLKDSTTLASTANFDVENAVENLQAKVTEIYEKLSENINLIDHALTEKDKEQTNT